MVAHEARRIQFEIVTVAHHINTSYIVGLYIMIVRLLVIWEAGSIYAVFAEVSVTCEVVFVASGVRFPIIVYWFSAVAGLIIALVESSICNDSTDVSIGFVSDIVFYFSIWD